MASFEGTLRIEGERSEPLAVKAVVDDGALSLAADGVTLGSWPLTVVSAEPRGAGVGLVLDDDHVVIDLPDVELFIAAVTPLKKKRRKARSRQVNREQLRKPTEQTPAAEPKRKASTPASATRARAGKKEKKEKKDKQAEAQRRIPGRVVAIGAGAVAFIALSLLFSELVGSILLLLGLVLVMAGSLGLVETGVALRIPLGLQAMHLVVGGVVSVLAGTLLTLVA